jgi:Ca2+-dependent lipid-binding protein/Ca2+-binding EF-hand superfamily protein
VVSKVSVEANNENMMGFLTLLGKNTVKLADIIPADKHNVQTPVAITLPFSKKNAKGGDGQLSFNAVLTAPPKPQTNPPVDNAQKPPATVAPAPSSSAQPPAGAGQPPPTTAQPASSSAQAAPAAAAGAGAGTGTGTGHSEQQHSATAPSGKDGNNKPSTTDSQPGPSKPTPATSEPAPKSAPAAGHSEAPKPGSGDHHESELIPVSRDQMQNQKPASGAVPNVTNNIKTTESKIPEVAMYRIVRIETANLKKTDFMGKGDPYIRLSFGNDNWHCTTVTQRGGGPNVHWDYAAEDHKMEIKLSGAEFDSDSMVVTAWDENDLLSDAFVGDCTNKLPPNLKMAPPNTSVPVAFSLIDKSKKAAGVVTIHFQRKDAPADPQPASAPAATAQPVPAPVKDKEPVPAGSPAPAAAPQTQAQPPASKPTPNDNKPANIDSLYITRIETANLKKTDMTGNGDPYIKLSLDENNASKWNFQTTVQRGGGPNVHWDYPAGDTAMVLPSLSATQFNSELCKLKVTAMDKNDFFSDAVVGEFSQVFPTNLLDAPANTDIPIQFALIDKSKKSAGVVTLFVRKHDPSKIPAAAPAVESAAASKSQPTASGKAKDIVKVPPFESGILKIKRINCSKLSNVEMLMGKNDNYVALTFGSEKKVTEVKEESGESALFDFLDFQFNVDADMLQLENVSVQVWDKNNLRSDVLIGAGEFNLFSLAQFPVGTEKEFSLDVHDPKGKVVGHVSVFAELHHDARPVDQITLPAAVPPNSVMKIRRIRCFELKDTSATFDSRVTRPQLQLLFKTGSQSVNSKPVMTETLDGVTGGAALFDYLDYEFDISSVEDIKSGLLHVEVISKSMASSSTIGGGEASIRPIALTIPDLKQATAETAAEAEIPIDIVDKHGGSAGRVIVYAVFGAKTVDAASKDAAGVPDAVLLKNCKDCALKIDAIRTHGLKNTEWMGKQDPYFIVKYKDWTQKTAVRDGAGTEAHWDQLSFIYNQLGKDEIMTAVLEVTCLDSNTSRADVLIGSAQVPLKQLLATFGIAKELTVQLVDDKKKSSGTAVFTCALIDRVIEEKKLEFPTNLPDDNEIIIKSIVAHNLAGSMSLFSDIKVFVRFKLVDNNNNKWTVDTDHVFGHEAAWNYLDVHSILLTSVDVKNLQLTVEVWQVGTLSNHVIGTCHVSLIRPALSYGNVIELPCQLLGDKDKPGAGSVVMHIGLQKKVEMAAAGAGVGKDAGPAIKDLIPAKFKFGGLMITQIQAQNLRNVELIGKNDPYVIIKFCDFEDKTPVFEDAGSNVLWDELEYCIDVTREDLVNGQLMIECWDKNHMTNDVKIGVANVSLKRAVHKIGNEVEVAAALLDDKGKDAGRVVLHLEIREGQREPPKTLPKDFTQAILHVESIRTFNLKNMEMIGQQDPFVVLTLNDYSYKTFTAQDQGSDVLFDYLDAKTIVNAETITNGKMLIEVWDENTVTAHALIGTASTNLRKLSKIDELVEINVNLKDKKGAPTGRLTLNMKLENVPPPKDAAVELPKDFTIGEVNIKRIRCLGLRNINWIPGTKQDPYVDLSFGSVWSDKTSVALDKGTNCLWDFLDFTFQLPKAQLLASEAMFTVFVKDKETVIGECTVPLRRALLQLGNEVELSGDLINTKEKSTDEKKRNAGRIVLYVEIKKPEPPPVMNPGFAYGTLRINKICTADLANTEDIFSGKQDPYCVLQFGEWKQKTHTKDEGGSDVTWDYLDFQCDVYKETISAQKLAIQLFDENQFPKSDTLIGTAEISLLKCGANIGAEQTLHATLLDGKQKPAGRLTIFATVDGPEPELVVPESFQQGLLSVKAVSVLGLKGGGDWFSKTDPYVKLELGKFSDVTKTLNNAGEDAVWDKLGFKIPVDKKDARVGKLLVEALDKGNTSDTHLGIAEIPLLRAAANIGKEIKLNGEFRDAKGKLAGRVVLLTRLDAVTVLEPELLLPPDFVSGTITISKMQAKDLTNTELMGKQDPFVQLELGDWSESTVTLNNAGGKATWNNLNIQAEVNKDILKNNKLKLTVLDENFSRKDKVLGTGQFNVRLLTGPVMNSEKTFSVPLVSSSGAAAGTIVLTACLGPLVPSMALDGIPDTSINPKLEEAKLIISECAAFNLIGGDGSFLGIYGDMLDKPDPYIQFQCGDWTDKTTTIKEGGRFPVWKDIQNMETVVTRDQILLNRLQIAVKDKNSMTSDTVLGQGSITLKGWGSKMGAKQTFTVKLKTSRGQSAGRLEISGIMWALPPKPKEAPMDPNVPPVKGTLKIKSIALSEMKKDKKDLSLELGVGTLWTTTTQSNPNATDTATFTAVADSTGIYDGQLRKFPIRVTVFKKGMLGGKDIMGEAGLSTSEIIRTPNTITAVVGTILDKANQPIGKVVMNCAYLHDGADLVDPIQQGAQMRDLLNAGIRGDQATSGSAVGGTEVVGSEELEELRKKLLGMDKNVAGMEEKMRLRLQKELEAERGKMLSALQQQKDEFAKAMEAMNKLNAERGISATKTNNLLDSFVVGEIRNVNLPPDKNNWKTIHVQAWLSIKMELPNYNANFAEASVDGPLLLNYVDDKCMRDILGVSELHVPKLRKGITKLREEQELYDKEMARLRAEEDKRKAEAREKKRKEEEEEAARRRAKELAEKKRRKKDKKQKSKLKATAATMTMGEFRENNNGIDRAKLTYDARKVRTAKDACQRELDKQKSTWRFEYTGTERPPAEAEQDLYAELDDAMKRQSKGLGSKTYLKELGFNVLSSEEFMNATTKDSTGHLKTEALAVYNPTKRRVRTIPANCPTDEVLVAVKAAMFEVSDWLIHVENRLRNMKRRANSDVDDVMFGSVRIPTNKFGTIPTIETDSDYYDTDGVNIEDMEIEDEDASSPQKKSRPQQQQQQQQNQLMRGPGGGDESMPEDVPAPSEHGSKVSRKAAAKSAKKGAEGHDDVLNDAEDVELDLGDEEGAEDDDDDDDAIPPPSFTDKYVPVVEPKSTQKSQKQPASSNAVRTDKDQQVEKHDGDAEEQPTAAIMFVPTAGDALTPDDVIPATAQSKPKSKSQPSSTGKVGGDEDEDDDGPPPPTFTESIKTYPLRPNSAKGGNKSKPLEVSGSAAKINVTGAISPALDVLADDEEDFEWPVDRINCVFSAFVQRNNNAARWLGPNSKLTRIKFEGGIESILRLRMEWEQFDALWTRLDYQRSGDIDRDEFVRFFGDLAEFEKNEGTAELTLTAGIGKYAGTDSTSLAMRTLTRSLYELCDFMRAANYSVSRMFTAFDRNGSGEISSSEFCSLLREVLGSHNVDKKAIYRALGVLDSDGSKSISLEELCTFMYKVWKAQLSDLAAELMELDEKDELEKKKIDKIVKERTSIKEAIKLNFPRQWRDKLERMGNTGLPGPFTALLQHLGLQERPASMTASTPQTKTNNPTIQVPTAGAGAGVGASRGDESIMFGEEDIDMNSPAKRDTYGSPHRHNYEHTQGSSHTPGGGTGRSPQHKHRSLNSSLLAAGTGTLARIKLKPPTLQAPTRHIAGSSTTLGIPTVKNLGADKFVSSETTNMLLNKAQHTYSGGYFY